MILAPILRDRVSESSRVLQEVRQTRALHHSHKIAFGNRGAIAIHIGGLSHGRFPESQSDPLAGDRPIRSVHRGVPVPRIGV